MVGARTRGRPRRGKPKSPPRRQPHAAPSSPLFSHFIPLVPFHPPARPLGGRPATTPGPGAASSTETEVPAASQRGGASVFLVSFPPTGVRIGGKLHTRFGCAGLRPREPFDGRALTVA